VFLVAENHAGKTSVANGLGAEYKDFGHYSIREIIKTMHLLTTDENPLTDRDGLQAFSQAMKKQYGPEIFIKKALTEFDNSSHKICIIESLRCPGEPHWLRHHSAKDFPDIDILIIGLTASVPERYGRFCHSRQDNIATVLSYEEFIRHDDLVNKGTQSWEENIAETIKNVDYSIRNADNALSSTIIQFKQAISTVYVV